MRGKLGAEWGRGRGRLAPRVKGGCWGLAGTGVWCFDGAARDALVRVAATAAEKKVRLEVARGWAATSSPGEEEARMVTATRRDADRLRVAEAPEIAAGMVEDIVDIVVASTVRRVLASSASSPLLSVGAWAERSQYW